MLHSKYHFALAVVAAVFSVNFPKVADAQVGNAGPYGGYYPIPGGHNIAPLSSGQESSSQSPESRSTSFDNDCWNQVYDNYNNGMEYWDNIISESEFNSPQYLHAKEMKQIIRIKLSSC